MDLFDEAIAAYHEVLNYDSQHLKALFNVARLYHTQGDHANAILNFEQVLQKDPHNAQTYNSLGLIYEELEDWRNAISCFHKAAELDMFFPEVHLNLVRALYHHRGGDLSPDILQDLIERLHMVLSLGVDSEALQPIRHKVERFLAFLTASQ
jgi:tetratricopeptide (TPR) repeat protein